MLTPEKILFFPTKRTGKSARVQLVTVLALSELLFGRGSCLEEMMGRVCGTIACGIWDCGIATSHHRRSLHQRGTHFVTVYTMIGIDCPPLDRLFITRFYLFSHFYIHLFTHFRSLLLSHFWYIFGARSGISWMALRGRVFFFRHDFSQTWTRAFTLRYVVHENL